MKLFTANDGERSASLSFWTIAGVPSVPAISNLESAQSIDMTSGFTLKWNSLSGSSLDIVQLTILDGSSNLVFATAPPFEPGALSGQSTSTTIPPNELPSGTAFTGHLSIARPAGMLNTEYAMGLSAFSKDTSFPLVTRPAPVRPVLMVVTEESAMRVSFVAEPSRNFHLQESEDMILWTDLLVTNPPTANVTFLDTEAGRLRRFYRVQVGP